MQDQIQKLIAIKPDLLIEFPNQPYADNLVELLEKKFIKIKNGKS